MTAAPVQAREGWIDAARGIAIVLVVLFHAVLYTNQIGLAGPWSKLAFTLDTFRMPLFFFISGMLARRVLAGPLRGVLRFRALNFVYLYVVWSVVLVALMVALPDRPGVSSASWGALVHLFTRPNENLWFLYALALFFVVGWLLRRLPAWVQIAPAAVLSALFASGVLDTASTPWDKTCRYWFFFVLACHVGPLVRRVAPRLRLWHAALLTAVYGALIVTLVLHGLDRILFVRPALGLLAVATGSAWAVVASRHRLFDGLRVLGTRTLPIYLVHTLPMIAIVTALAPAASALPGWTALVAVPLLTAGAIAIALLLHRLLDARVPGVFRFPIRSWVTPPRRSEVPSERVPAVG